MYLTTKMFLVSLLQQVSSWCTVNYLDSGFYFACSPIPVVGHAGKLVFGKLAGAEVVCMKGRFHSYEGHAMPILALPIRTMKRMGVEILFVTNAAGGLSSDFNLVSTVFITNSCTSLICLFATQK
jgi:hypothetical protein